jgi:hypothetical protein
MIGMAFKTLWFEITEMVENRSFSVRWTHWKCERDGWGWKDSQWNRNSRIQKVQVYHPSQNMIPRIIITISKFSLPKTILNLFLCLHPSNLRFSLEMFAGLSDLAFSTVVSSETYLQHRDLGFPLFGPNLLLPLPNHTLRNECQMADRRFWESLPIRPQHSIFDVTLRAILLHEVLTADHFPFKLCH